MDQINEEEDSIEWEYEGSGEQDDNVPMPSFNNQPRKSEFLSQEDDIFLEDRLSIWDTENK